MRVSGIPRQSAQPALSQDLASSNKELEIERAGFPAAAARADQGGKLRHEDQLSVINLNNKTRSHSLS